MRANTMTATDAHDEQSRRDRQILEQARELMPTPEEIATIQRGMEIEQRVQHGLRMLLADPYGQADTDRLNSLRAATVAELLQSLSGDARHPLYTELAQHFESIDPKWAEPGSFRDALAERAEIVLRRYSFNG